MTIRATPPQHPPGDRLAIDAGCLCPRRDNHYGAGMFAHDGVTYYVMFVACPLHGHLVKNPGDGGLGWPNEEVMQ